MILSARIENWGRWTRATGKSEHSMTAIVCDSMRRNSLGEVWAGHSGEARLNGADAQLVEKAWRAQTQLHRDLLRWHHIRNAPIAFTCRRLKIKHSPASVFAIALAEAEDALHRTLVRLDRGT